MSGAADEEMEDFFAALRNDETYLAPTFYTAVGIVATLVIIIIILMIGYCYFARYLVVRTRLMNRKVKLLTSPQDDDIIELEVKTTTQKSGSVDHGGEEDNDDKEQAEQQRQLSQDNVAVELSGFKEKDTTPLIQEPADGEAPNQNQTTGIEQMKNIPEGIVLYASVNKDAKTGNGVTHDDNKMIVTADLAPPTGHGITVGDEDYAEVKCEHNTGYTYQYQPHNNIRTKDRSCTLPCTATVDIDLETEDYSRLVHETQPNPRFSMPLLSDYSRIGMDGARWHSLEMELDQNQNVNEDLYATPNPQNRLNREKRSNTPGTHGDTPSPLPTPDIDDPDKTLGSGSQESRPALSQKLDNETVSDMPKGDSPPPLPPPYVDGELEETSEALYDEAINHYQNVSDCIESGIGNIQGCIDGKGGLNSHSKDMDALVKENMGTMNTDDLQEGIYDSIDQEAD